MDEFGGSLSHARARDRDVEITGPGQPERPGQVDRPDLLPRHELPDGSQVVGRCGSQRERRRRSRG
jgi:hypothetical protein